MCRHWMRTLSNVQETYKQDSLLCLGKLPLNLAHDLNQILLGVDFNRMQRKDCGTCSCYVPGALLSMKRV